VLGRCGRHQRALATRRWETGPLHGGSCEALGQAAQGGCGEDGVDTELRGWVSGGVGSVGVGVGLDELQGLLQPKRFYDSAAGCRCAGERGPGAGGARVLPQLVLAFWFLFLKLPLEEPS